jgi:hypothetical protein
VGAAFLEERFSDRINVASGTASPTAGIRQKSYNVSAKEEMLRKI